VLEKDPGVVWKDYQQTNWFYWNCMDLGHDLYGMSGTTDAIVFRPCAERKCGSGGWS